MDDLESDELPPLLPLHPDGDVILELWGTRPRILAHSWNLRHVSPLFYTRLEPHFGKGQQLREMEETEQPLSLQIDYEDSKAMETLMRIFYHRIKSDFTPNPKELADLCVLAKKYGCKAHVSWGCVMWMEKLRDKHRDSFYHLWHLAIACVILESRRYFERLTRLLASQAWAADIRTAPSRTHDKLLGMALAVEIQDTAANAVRRAMAHREVSDLAELSSELIYKHYLPICLGCFRISAGVENNWDKDLHNFEICR